MRWAKGGWTLYTEYGSTVTVNGQRICNLDTILALVRMGLIEQVEQWGWRATEKEKL